MSVDLVIRQGVTFRKEFVWQDANGVAINLSNWKARMQIRKKAGGDLLLDLRSDPADPAFRANAKLVITAATGTVAVYIGATVTAALASNGVYDLELASLTDPEEVERLVEGTVTLSKEVTV